MGVETQKPTFRPWVLFPNCSQILLALLLIVGVATAQQSPQIVVPAPESHRTFRVPFREVNHRILIEVEVDGNGPYTPASRHRSASQRVVTRKSQREKSTGKVAPGPSVPFPLGPLPRGSTVRAPTTTEAFKKKNLNQKFEIWLPLDRCPESLGRQAETEVSITALIIRHVQKRRGDEITVAGRYSAKGGSACSRLNIGCLLMRTMSCCTAANVPL